MATDLLASAASSWLSGIASGALPIEQHARMLQLESALPELALIPERLVMHEAVSQPFEMKLDALSLSAHVDLGRLIGEQLTVRLLQPDGAYRSWHGYVFEASQLGSDGGLARYRLVMRPWLAFLESRLDSFVYQDKTALEIIEDIAADCREANLRLEVSATLARRSLCCQYRESDLAFVMRLLASEGLSWHIEHLEGEAAANAQQAGHARHCMVITDDRSARRHLGDIRFTRQHPTANVAGQKDAITAFMAQRKLEANAVALGSWDYKRLAGIDSQAQSALDLGEIPGLEIYDGSGAYRWQDPQAAQRRAALSLTALELDVKRFEGQGSARHLQAGARFSLVDHPVYGANTTAFDNPGALLASHPRSDNTLTVLAVEHHATNNLGSQIAELLDNTELEHGTYKNHFHAVPAAAAIVPRWIPKPTSHGTQPAIVVGIDGEALTTDRDLRVKIQFPWQRGRAPLTGGMAHDDSSADARGNAPGDERSGTWVRVAQPSAGANWGSSFVPRIGGEVGVAYIEGDIDRPVVAGQLYNGADAPPYAAGVDSGVNHPGVISGIHSRALDGGATNEWLVDDAAGQLRTRLAASTAQAQLALGHLIQQAAGNAQRGGWQGSGLEARTSGWVTLRANQGLAITSTTRAGSHGSAQSGQLDLSEALAQMSGAHDLGQRLSGVAKSQGAHELTAHRNDDKQAWPSLMKTLDPQHDGKLPQAVNGQQAHHLDAERKPTTAIEAMAAPLVVLDTPASAAWASAGSIHAFSGQDTSLVAQGDLHIASAHTHAAVSGQTTSLYTHTGGIQAKAAAGPVSIRAHTGELQLWADREVQVVSVNDEIRIQAKTKIELTAADSSIVLDGGDITFTTPGTFEAKHSGHQFLEGASRPASPQQLPQGAMGMMKVADRPGALERFKKGVDAWIDDKVEASGYHPLAMGAGALGKAVNELVTPQSGADVLLMATGPVGKVVKKGGKVIGGATGVAAAVPKSSDPKLANIVGDLYKGARGPNPIGTGSTADAIRNELATGQPTGGRFHSQKGAEYIRAIENWLSKNPNASHYDRMVAESLKNDLMNALGR